MIVEGLSIYEFLNNYFKVTLFFKELKNKITRLMINKDFQLVYKLKKFVTNKHVKTKDTKKVSSLNDVEKVLIISHSGIEMDENTTVCLHHEYIYLKH